tara:strand:- start:3666 stop:4112 length:447 start_codon:yes stop_codon:yes gene_type:complete
MSFDPQFTVDADSAPTFTLSNFDDQLGTFDISFNSPELKNSDNYTVSYSIHNLKDEETEPVLFQLAQIVFWEVEKLKAEERDKRSLKIALTGLLNQELTVAPEDMNRHRERMFKKNGIDIQPSLTQTAVVNVHSEEDFDSAFEAASGE